MGNQMSLSPYSPSSFKSRKNRVYVSYWDPARGVVDMSVPLSGRAQEIAVHRS